jgi:hypothetical protein
MEVPTKRIILNGEEIKLANEVKYLDMTFDHKLRWDTHIERRVQKANITLWLYKAIVRATLAYGSLVW